MIFRELIVGSVYVMLHALSFDILLNSGSLGESPKSPRGRHSNMGVWGWSWPWVWVLEDMGFDLPLGDAPNSHYYTDLASMEHWYLMCRLVGVSSLSVVKGWKRKNKNETRKHMHTCSIWLHIY